MTANVKTRYSKTGSKKLKRGGKTFEVAHPERPKDLTISPSLTNAEKKLIPSHYKKTWPYLTKTTRANILSKVRRGVDLTKDKRW